ncbi:MAG: NAD-dependent epimerase/dehydratase family protein, partial [Acetatifactor sp.]|nr:NAD-dependent epimerase/dehydratase family protein [Acetatifactor sp.]
MKVLFIGGTGTISMAITRLLAARGDEVFLINRGSRSDELPENVQVINCDINDEKSAAGKIKDMSFDC